MALLDDVHILETDHETLLKALHSRIIDIEDAIQYATALHHKLDVFISRDKKLQKEATSLLPVYSPEAYFKLFEPYP